MQPHQQRVVEEKKELDEKINKLNDFIETNPVFATLDPNERARLCLQRMYMWGYSYILAKRIAAFNS